MSLNMQGKVINNKVVGGIEWTKTKHPDGTETRGATWNPIAGCPHGCRWTMPDGNVAICYAEDIAHGIAKSVYPDGFDAHYWKPHMLQDPVKHKAPLKIFVGSMSDVFAHSVPSEQIEQVLQVARDCPQHIFQFLTKNPVRTKEFDMPDNVWLGASMPPDFMWGNPLSREQQARMLMRSLDSLSESNAKIKWMSFEPLSWNVAPIVKYNNVFDWAVIGAASNGRKHYAPDAHVFTQLHDVLLSQNVPMFYKGNLASLPEAKANWREEFPVKDSNQ